MTEWAHPRWTRSRRLAHPSRRHSRACAVTRVRTHRAPFGTHRRTEAVVIAHATYAALRGPAANTGSPILDQMLERRDFLRRLAEVNHIRAVSVFGSVARRAESRDSDVDLLVEPDDEATLLDLAQFAPTWSSSWHGTSTWSAGQPSILHDRPTGVCWARRSRCDARP